MAEHLPAAAGGEGFTAQSERLGLPLHVDLVLTDFHACEVRRVAVLHDGGVEVKAEWLEEEVVELPGAVYSAVMRRDVQPTEAAPYLEALHDVLNSSLLHATDIHDVTSCPYHDHNAIPFGEPLSYPGMASGNNG